MSFVCLKDLVVEGKHGVHEHEKVTPQRFNINLELEVNTPRAFISDDIDDTVSYSEIRRTIIQTVQDNTFDLIERLADEIIHALSADKRIKTISIAIEKLDVYTTGIPGIRVTYQNI